jgi:glycosyltransferase involved in cell wall biosynthesis
MSNRTTVTAIVSVYNEEKTVGNVVTSLLDCHAIDEVIVVNDGSTDESGRIIRSLQRSHLFKYIALPENRGKSYAMATGTEAARGKVILFVDADIVGLTCSHIRKMLDTLLEGKADMVIGQPYADSGKRKDPLKPLELLAGERAVYKQDIYPIVDKMRSTKYGAETLLNLYYKSKGKTIRVEYLWGVTHLKKFRKQGLRYSLKNYFLEAGHIFRTTISNYILIVAIAKSLLLKR